MKIVDLTQRSEKWHEFRRNGIGSSEIHGLLTSPMFGAYWKALKKQKLGKAVEEFESEAMRWGKEQEPMALAALQKINPNLKPVCAIHEEYPYIRCSFDAIDGDEVHEIKCPQVVNLEECLLGRIPDKWINQLRWQMMIADAAVGNLDFWDSVSIHPHVVERDLSWDKKAIEIATQFWVWVQDGEMPEDEYEECFDEEKCNLLQKYKEHQAQIKELEKQAEDLKKSIIAGMEKNFILDGSKVFQTANASYDYKKMIEDFSIPKETYRKFSKPFWKIAL